MALRNRDRLQQIIRDESIDCDFSPRGWLYLAHTESEEQGICEEVMLGAQHGQRIELWPRQKIFQEFNIRTDFVGRFVPGDGTYHPFKYVCGVISAALKSGVQLYTRVRVNRIRSISPDRHHVTTDRGRIVARRVIVATNAFTRELLPEMRSISPRQSQVMLTEHALDRARGRTITTEQGPAFFNQPRAEARHGRAPLLFGGGNDRPMKNPRHAADHSQFTTCCCACAIDTIPNCAASRRLLSGSGRWPSRRMDCRRSDLFAPASSSPPASTAMAAATPLPPGKPALKWRSPTNPELDAAGRLLPAPVPQQQPLFLSSKDNLWRIAQALCKRLVVVNEQISFECTYGATSVPGETPEISTMTLEGMISQPGSTIKPDALRDFPRFGVFSDRELRQLLRLMRRWDLPQGTVVVSEGGPGGSCFIIASGSVDVTVRVRSRQQLLAQLPAGSIFGQVSLISGEPRTATCSMRNDGLILELERKPCETFLSAGSPPP